MKPDRRAELRRLEDASFRTTASHDNEVLKERIKALELLLSNICAEVCLISPTERSIDLNVMLSEADAILPKTEEVNNG